MMIIIFLIIIFFVLFIDGISSGIIKRRLDNGQYDLLELRFDKSSTDSLKGLMAIGIMISHVALNTVDSMEGAGEYLRLLLVSLGGVGVAVFFTLSGFGCYFSVNKRVTDFKSGCKWSGQKILRMLVIFLLCYVPVGILYLIMGGGVEKL